MMRELRYGKDEAEVQNQLDESDPAFRGRHAITQQRVFHSRRRGMKWAALAKSPNCSLTCAARVPTDWARQATRQRRAAFIHTQRDLLAPSCPFLDCA